MDFVGVAGILLTLAALFGVINHCFLRLPTTIGLMLIALVFSMGLLATGWWFPGMKSWAVVLLEGIDFNRTLLHGMLGFLLFAGALHVNLNDLRQHYRVITALATVGVLVSTGLIGLFLWLVSALLGLGLEFIHCLLFGALISPTDPIAVLGILKTANAPKSLETKIAGESLFNDGVGVVIFLVLLDIAYHGLAVTPGGIGLLFIKEALGGAAFGLVAGLIAYWLLKNVDNYQVEVLITLALVVGGYRLAEALHLSAPIAIVVAGLLIGNHGRSFAMSERTREHLDPFWELVDEVLNAVLFVLLGLEILVLSVSGKELAVGLLAIPLVLIARLVSVGLPVGILRFFLTFSPHVVTILTWSGLRGGISVALALSLPPGRERHLILAITYAVVVFSVLVQGLTIGWLVRKTQAVPASRQ
ncbi:MAG: sodium:proton antiporter [Deltaproteobacteria bacterium RIFOXYD12_FULL_57_12]|nr:MAG: sodium:proton antiporter [Deltaproteobacteria bacterium RIFOXYD12_FULL_57_12]